MEEPRTIGHTTKKAFRSIMQPEFFALALLTGIWWTAQLSLAGYLMYRIYNFVSSLQLAFMQ